MMLCLSGINTGLVLGQTTWDGSSGTNWNTAANWSTNAVPTRQDDVVIPPSLTNYPHIGMGTGALPICRDLTFQTGGTSNQVRLDIDNGYSIDVYGSLANDYGFKAVMGTDAWVRFCCNSSSPASPSSFTITGDINLLGFAIVKTCGGSYSASIPSGTDVTITDHAAIQGCSLVVGGNLCTCTRTRFFQ